MILHKEDGIVARTSQEADQARLAGCVQCATYHNPQQRFPQGMYCPFWMPHETQTTVTDQGGGYYTCPICRQSHDLLHELPWHGVEEEVNPSFYAGGGTRIGLGMDVQAQIGEDLVRNLKEIPGYGPVVWFHEGAANVPSPLDAATKDWGVEIKTLGYDAAHHRFVPGRPQEKADKNQMAESMNKQGVLGVLVLLDYRRSVADIYVQEFPLATGVKAFRSNAPGSSHLVREMPFRNPLMDPHDPSPKAEGFEPSAVHEDWGF